MNSHSTKFRWPLFALLCSVSAEVNISNIEPRRDINGHLMDIHDGNIAQWHEGGLYYYYGMGYQNCTEKTGLIPPIDCPGIYKSFGECGFREDHVVNIYSSPDLLHWTFRGEALPRGRRPEGIYFRPKVIFNNSTQKFVLWINYLPPVNSWPYTPLHAYPNATYVVAQSSTPDGIFMVSTIRASVKNKGGGDFALFVDHADSDQAYIAYDAWSNGHRVTLERLSDDYLDSLGETVAAAFPPDNEAPIIFTRNGWYYLLFGTVCCFCHEGSGSEVWVAPSPLGPWNNTGSDIGRHIDWPHSSIARAQENYVFTVQDSKGDEIFVWTGDRWGSAPDGLKSHDLQYWQPLVFDDTASPPTISRLSWVDSFSLDI